MGGHEARSYGEHVGLVMLLGGFFLAPTAWFLDLQISYAAIKWVCEHNSRWVLLLLPVVSLAFIGAGTWMSWSAFTQLRDSTDEEGARMEDRSYFLAVSGLVMNGIFALLILASLVPRYFLSPCE